MASRCPTMFSFSRSRATLKLPANLTAWTGIDAMIHAIEGYSVPMFHPLCDGSALESLNLISKSLYAAVEEPDNLSLIHI